MTKDERMWHWGRPRYTRYSPAIATGIVMLRKLTAIFRQNAQVIVIMFVLGISACTSKSLDIIHLMPAPDVYMDESIDPFADLHLEFGSPYHGMLYATDRKPVMEPDEKTFYLNERGFELRLGIAHVSMGEGQYTWEEVRQISLLKNRGDKYPLKVTSVEETGVLDQSLSIFSNPEIIPADQEAAKQRFAELINSKLAVSKKKDVYIYVHGYKVVFNNPLLVSRLP